MNLKDPEAQFQRWFRLLQSFAREHDWVLGSPNQYREYFEDGDSPSETLEMEMRALADGD